MNYIVLFILTVLLGRNSAQEIFETVEAVVGHSAELPCNVTPDNENDQLRILAWYRNGSSTAFYSSSDFRGGDSAATSPGGRYQLLTTESSGMVKLQILYVHPSDAGGYECLADFASSPAQRTTVQLLVIEPPRHLWVVHENGTQVAKASIGVNVSQNIGPYYVGDIVHLFCVAYGGKPLSSLSWISEQRLLKDTSTPLSEQRARSDFIFGPLQREDHGRVLTCSASNNNKTAPLYIDVVIDMFLPPELVSLRSETLDGQVQGRVEAGEALTLQCRVLGARPPPPLVWRLGDGQLHSLDQNITMEPSQRLVVSEIKLTVGREYDESRITCCAPSYRRNDNNYVCAQSLPLTVLYRPVLQIVVNTELNDNILVVEKGSNVSMGCTYQANPSVFDLRWYHVNDTFVDERVTESVQARLELTNVTDNDAGEYVCIATNDLGVSYSDPIIIDITYPAQCQGTGTTEYGLGENETMNITCIVKANPSPSAYRWMLFDEAVNITTLRDQPHKTIETEGPTLQYQRPNGTAFSTIFCWGINNVTGTDLPNSPCAFSVTDETTPLPPTKCVAVRTAKEDISVTCEKGHDGGLPQKFKFTAFSMDSKDQIISIINVEPEFKIKEPDQDYKFVIVAFNDKGDSSAVDIEKGDVAGETRGKVRQASAVADITTLALALCGGVALVALAACGLVLCAHERGSRPDLPRERGDPPLCAYNTDESNCETYHDSDDGSDCNVRRTESFRRAVTRHPSRNFDVRRTSSFHSARYLAEDHDPPTAKYNEGRHSTHCRVHSLQNISKKRDMDTCDHFVVHLPPETNYNVAKPMNTFYTMPRKMRHKLAKELSDETSEITQTSDGFSLPPPPDEFGTYRAGTRIKDMPVKTTATYSTVIRKNSGKELPKQHYNNVIISPMNTVGLPTISGSHALYSYPGEDHHMQANTNPFDDDST